MELQKIRQGISDLCYVMIILIMPFYFENGYFNMIEAKARFLWVTGGILFLAIIVCYVSGIVLKIYKHSISGVPKQNIKQNMKNRLSMLDISILLFLCSAVCSGFVSKTPGEAFWGNGGWSMGILTLAILVIMYFFVSENIEFHSYMTVTAILSSFALYVMGILHSFHVDLFGLHQRISDNYYNYISTIGNVNWYVGYLSMMFPMGCLLYLNSKNCWMKQLLFIYVNLGFYNVIICKSDGVILGLASSCLVVGCFLIKHKNFLEDFMKLMLSISVIMGIVFLLLTYYPGEYVQIDGIFLLIIEKKIWLVMGTGALCTLCFLKTDIKKKIILKIKFTELEKNIVLSILFVAIGIAVLIYEISVFEDGWGTGRGLLWICTYNLFSNFKWIYKIFGCGCDCFGIAFLSKYSSYVDGIYLNAHNEFLQYLVTMGLFGLATYGMIWFSAGKMFIQKKEKYIIDWMLFSGIAGYLGQSVVNNPQALNYAVLFLMLALLKKSCNYKKIP